MASALTRAVLGIDAAWTPTQPSGVALAVKVGSGWSLQSLAPSYTAFAPAGASHPAHTAMALLGAVSARIGRRPSVVAVDMPLAHSPITRRRAADDAVSRAYGARHCSTHTPSALRPGPISDELRAGFEHEGYRLATTVLEEPALIEVYPHPALVELTGGPRRLPYKVAKGRSYWPDLAPGARREALIRVWAEIILALDEVLDGVSALLTLPSADASGRVLKAFEDQLDAVVCAWCGICALEGRAQAFGDADAAVWIPQREAIFERAQGARLERIG